MSILKNIWSKRSWVRALIPSLIFNFRHLPLSQACHLPILLYKAELRNTSGKFQIIGPVRFAMIRLGFETVSLYPNNGIMIQNRGTIVFKGKTHIGNNSALSIGATGTLEFGDRFSATTGLKLACFNSIKFGDNVLIGWNNLFSDTDFHSLKNVNLGGGKE